MKSYDIAKTMIDVLSGSEVRETINSVERSLYQQEKQWIDYDIFVTHSKWYKQREEILYEQLRRYAKTHSMLNKNIKIL